MDTIPGDKFIGDCAKYIRFNEAKLGDVAGPSSSSSAAAGTSLNWMNPASWLIAGSTLPTNARSPAQTPPPQPVTAIHRPMPFRITSHHLYYLLIRCEALGLPIGTLDVRIPARSRPSSYFAFISSNAAGATHRKRDADETMSVNSLQTTFSLLGLGGPGGPGGRQAARNGSLSWWSTEKQDVVGELKYIYSAMTKIPALRIGPPPLKLVRDFEDCPGEMSVPLDALKNVHYLEFEDADPRAFLGWDRLCIQLRSLSIKRSGVEDVSDIIIDAVLADAQRRKGLPVKTRQRKAHSSEETEATTSSATNTVDDDDDGTAAAKELPSLAWHFLRHMSLSENSLTFLHPAPISCLTSLTSLDLSNNLLNAVPPSLSVLPRLRSLNVSNNLIDSVLGIPDCIPHVHALNLSHNRLESLCGLERLAHLSRVDLRANEVFEAGEVGRLATLEHIVEVYVAENPLMEEEEDPRVLVFNEFAKEGRDIDLLKLDDETIGYFERQRVRETVPNLDRLRKTRQQTRKDTPSAPELARMSKRTDAVSGKGSTVKAAPTETNAAAQELPRARRPAEEEARATEGSVIKSVRHRRQSHRGGGDRQAEARDAAAAGQRRNRRVVTLSDSVQEGEGLAGLAQKAVVVEESDSDIIKRAALAGDVDVAIGTSAPAPPPNTAARSATTEAASRHRLGRKALDRTPSNQSANEGQRKSNDGRPAEATGLTSQELRRKIETLKGEVGDDWMRLLARGEST